MLTESENKEVIFIIYAFHMRKPMSTQIELMLYWLGSGGNDEMFQTQITVRSVFHKIMSIYSLPKDMKQLHSLLISLSIDIGRA